MTASARGEDRSGYQAVLPWTGLDFGFCKATEGTTYIDPTFAANWAAMKAAGIRRGAYHFFHPGLDPGEQAALFMSVIARNGLRPGDMLAIDTEISTGLDGTLLMKHPDAATRSALLRPGRNGRAVIRRATVYPNWRNWHPGLPAKSAGLPVGTAARQSLDLVRDAARSITGGGHCPVLTYSYLDFLPYLTACTPYPLWLASYAGEAPESAQPWPGWVIWQYSGGGGRGGSDQDQWNGTRQDMDHWISSWRQPDANWTENLVNELPLLQESTSISPDVRTLQGCLIARNYTVKVDGVYGPQTGIAVRAFQASAGLTADGIVGPLTWAKLLNR